MSSDVDKLIERARALASYYALEAQSIDEAKERLSLEDQKKFESATASCLSDIAHAVTNMGSDGKRYSDDDPPENYILNLTFCETIHVRLSFNRVALANLIRAYCRSMDYARSEQRIQAFISTGRDITEDRTTVETRTSSVVVLPANAGPDEFREWPIDHQMGCSVQRLGWVIEGGKQYEDVWAHEYTRIDDLAWDMERYIEFSLRHQIPQWLEKILDQADIKARIGDRVQKAIYEAAGFVPPQGLDVFAGHGGARSAKRWLAGIDAGQLRTFQYHYGRILTILQEANKTIKGGRGGRRGKSGGLSSSGRDLCLKAGVSEELINRLVKSKPSEVALEYAARKGLRNYLKDSKPPRELRKLLPVKSSKKGIDKAPASRFIN